MNRFSNRYRLQDALRLVSLLGLLLGMTACDATTVFLAKFESDTVGSPPAPAQATGTVKIDEGGGSVRVVDPPLATLPQNKWVRIRHQAAPSPETGMHCRFTGPSGLGKYSLLASLYIPGDAGVVNVNFETDQLGGNFVHFLHLDFMTEGDVRVDDGPVRFGHFPRNQAFELSVNLDITANKATAQIALLGGAASGSKKVTVNPTFLAPAKVFNTVQFGIGFQHKGSFFVDEILVTRQN